VRGASGSSVVIKPVLSTPERGPSSFERIALFPPLVNGLEFGGPPIPFDIHLRKSCSSVNDICTVCPLLASTTGILLRLKKRRAIKRKISALINTTVEEKTLPVKRGCANNSEELPTKELIGANMESPMLSGSPLEILG